MENALSKLIIVGLMALLPAGAQSARKIQVCVNPGNDTPFLVLIRAEAVSSRMFATAGLAVDWHSTGSAECRGVRGAATVVVDFTVKTPSSQHTGALAYAQVYEAVHMVVMFDRVAALARRSNELPNILAHVMTHEITHLLEGISRHSETGLMKAHWSPKDLDLMAYGPLPFTAEDIELIRLGLVRRETAAAPAID